MPTEVEFIDGSTELSNIVQIENENITFVSAGSNLYYFTLEQLTTSYPNNVLVGTPSFAAVRTKSSTFTTTNLFNIDGQQVSGTVLTSDGQWKIETGSGSTIVYLYSSSTPNEHVVSYRYKNSDPGIDVNGLYSIDYFNGTIYFSVPIADSGNITYEVSAYSGFYNLAEIVSEKYIKSINEVEQTITIESSFAIKFLKQNTIDNARPQIIKAIYSYFKKSTESLADLEPYWSPICKDVAFKAVTNTILEEL